MAKVKAFESVFYLGYNTSQFDGSLQYTKMERRIAIDRIPVDVLTTMRTDSVCIVVQQGKVIQLKSRFPVINEQYKFPYICNNEKKKLLITPTDNGAALIEYIVQSNLDLTNLSIEDEFTLLMIGANLSQNVVSTELELDFDNIYNTKGLSL